METLGEPAPAIPIFPGWTPWPGCDPMVSSICLVLSLLSGLLHSFVIIDCGHLHPSLPVRKPRSSVR